MTSASLRLAGTLARSCHPGPVVAVTGFSALLAVAAGNTAGTCVVLVAAVFAGQLSIGWSNDRLDAARDRASGRTDKPVARGEIATRALDTAIVTAVLATVALSLALGWRAGSLHLGAVACGWLYNAALKGSWWSWLPYALAFGALPGVATLASAGHPAPAVLITVAAALLGIAANLANALPDLEDDAATGIRGLPHRLGARGSLIAVTALLVASSVFLVLGPPGAPTALSAAELGVGVVAAASGLAVAWRQPAGRVAFYGIIAVVAVDLLVIAFGGNSIH